METVCKSFGKLKNFAKQSKPITDKNIKGKNLFSDFNEDIQLHNNSETTDGSRAHYCSSDDTRPSDLKFPGITKVAVNKQASTLQSRTVLSELKSNSEQVNYASLLGVKKTREKTDHSTEKTEDQTEDSSLIDGKLRERIRSSIARKFKKQKFQSSSSNLPFTEYFNITQTPDYEKLLSEKIIWNQTHINKLYVFRDLKRKYGTVPLTKGFFRYKFRKYFNHIIKYQPLKIKPIISDLDSIIFPSPVPVEKMNRSPEESPDDNSDSYMQEPSGPFPAESYRTPEKQQIRRINPNALKSKIKTGIMLAPKNYKSSIDCAPTVSKQTIDFYLPNVTLEEPVVYEFNGSQNFNFKPRIDNKTTTQFKFADMSLINDSQPIYESDDNSDDNFPHTKVVDRPKKQPKYDRRLKDFIAETTDLTDDSPVTKMTTPRRKLNYQNALKLDAIKKAPFSLDICPITHDNFLNTDFNMIDLANKPNDFQPSEKGQYLQELKNYITPLENMSEDMNSLNEFDDSRHYSSVANASGFNLSSLIECPDIPKAPDTPEFQYYPRSMH